MNTKALLIIGGLIAFWIFMVRPKPSVSVQTKAGEQNVVDQAFAYGEKATNIVGEWFKMTA